MAYAGDLKSLGPHRPCRFKSGPGHHPPSAAVFISSVDGKDQFQISKDAPSLRAKFSPDSKEVMFVDFNASRFVVGNISTRKLTPVAGSGANGYEYIVCDWK